MRRFALLILLAALPAQAASFYISPTGIDTGRGCTNQTTDACFSFPRCAAVMAAGDTCYALDGTYTTTGTNGWVFSSIAGGTAGSPKRFTSLSQDATKVTILASSPQTQNTMYGSASGSAVTYLTFDHLTIQGRTEWLGAANGIVWHNNILSCPNTGTGGGNQGPIIISGSITPMVSGIHIYENRFLYDDTCPALGTNINITFITMFHTNGALVEKNDFINNHSTLPMWTTLDLKRGNKDTIVRHNYFKGKPSDSNGSIRLMDCDGDSSFNQYGDRSSYGGSPTCKNIITQNVFDNNTQISVYGRGAATTRLNDVYNNTIVGTTGMAAGVTVEVDGGKTDGGDGWNIYNNIIVKTAGTFSYGYLGISLSATRTYPCMSHQSVVNNNLYWPSGLTWKDCSDYRTSSLSTWQSHSSPKESASIVADPLFETGSYKLQAGSPALTASTTGEPVGAYITGTEQIGCSAHAGCYSYGETAPPATSGNPRRVALTGVTFK